MSSSHHHDPPPDGSSVARSFHDYHLIVEDNEAPPQHAATLGTAVMQTPSFRRLTYDGAAEVYFDEDTTLASREEPVFPADAAFLSPNRRRRGSSGVLPPPPLNGKNYLNLVTYAAHLFVSWGIGIWGLGGLLETRWQITVRYESLVTPAVWSYHLWFPILILEGACAAAQCTAYYRNRPVVQDGIGYLFFYTTVLQTAWTLFFSFRCFVASFVSVVLALTCLVSLLFSQIWHSPDVVRNKKYWEFVLFRFPFLLHAGWMVLMVVDHLALLFRGPLGSTATSVQLAVDMTALALLLAAGVACLIRPPYQDFVIPAVIIWSLVS